MRTLGLLGLIAGLLLLTATASPWVARGLGGRFTFTRVYDRVFEVLLVVALPLVWRRLGLGTPASIGFRRAGWGRDLARGATTGLAGIASALMLCWLLGALVPALRFPPAKTARKAALGTAAAVVIGVGEETLFRGVVLRRLTLDLGTGAGVLVTTAVYAAVHAIGKGGAERGTDAWAGFRRTRDLFAPVARREAVPSLVGLALLGLVLAAARLRAGTLWLPIGVHAAFVAVFRVGRLFFDLHPTPVWLVGPGWPPLVGGAAGWLAVAVTGALLLVGDRRRRVRGLLSRFGPAC